MDSEMQKTNQEIVNKKLSKTQRCTGIILVIIATILCFLSKEASGIAFLICGCIFIFLSNIKYLVKYIKEINFKEGRILMQELSYSLEEVKKLSLFVAELAYDVIHARTFNATGIDCKKALGLYEEIEKILKDLKIPSNKINELKEKFKPQIEQIKDKVKSSND